MKDVHSTEDIKGQVRWHGIQHRNGDTRFREYLRPLKVCPNCGKAELSVYRDSKDESFDVVDTYFFGIFKQREFTFSKYEVWAECRQCKFKSEPETVPCSEYQVER